MFFGRSAYFCRSPSLFTKSSTKTWISCIGNEISPDKLQPHLWKAEYSLDTSWLWQTYLWNNLIPFASRPVPYLTSTTRARSLLRSFSLPGAHQGEHFHMMEVQVCIRRLFLLISSPIRISSCHWRQSNHPVIHLDVYHYITRTFFSGSSLVGGFHRQALLIECCGHVILLRMMYGLTVRRGRMTSAIYVPFRFFSTLRPPLLFNFKEANGRYTYVSAPIGSRNIWKTSLPRFTSPSIFWSRTIKERMGVASTNWYDKPCRSFLIFYFRSYIALGFQFKFPSPCSDVLWHICQTRRN